MPRFWCIVQSVLPWASVKWSDGDRSERAAMFTVEFVDRPNQITFAQINHDSDRSVRSFRSLTLSFPK